MKTNYALRLNGMVARYVVLLWKLVLEDGCSSVISALNSLGIPAVSGICRRLSLLAVKSSCIIWLNRFNRDFHTHRLKESPNSRPAVEDKQVGSTASVSVFP